jgi:ATP-dependent Clp protease ATP-binding subunit ClpA
LADAYFGKEDSMIRLDMSEYQTQDQIDKLLGSKSGAEYESNLTEKVSENPFSLILLDEFEKAHPKLLNLFLQVFDEGRLTDNRGKTISFKNCIIIATSNAGREFIREKHDSGAGISKEELLDYLLKNNIFTPELLNRFDDIIAFKFLNRDEIKKIAGIMLAREFAKLSENQIKIHFDESILTKVADEAYNAEFGARNIRRYIEDNLESFVSKLILEEKIKPGDVRLSVDQENRFVVI